MTLDVGIIGAGTAGSAAAILLARAGHKVTLYERVPEPRAVGAGIVIQPIGALVLERLGLARAIFSKGARLDRLRCIDARGEPIVSLTYDDFDGRWYGLGLHRGVLFQALLDGARAAGAAVALGVEVEGLERRGGKARLLDAKGAAIGSHDLALVCDGARSKVRAHTGIPARVAEYPWGALWFVAEDRARRHHTVLHQRVDGTGRMLGLLPTGTGPEGETPLVSLFWSVRKDRAEALKGAGFRSWKEEALLLEPAAGPALDQVRSGDDLLLSPYFDVVLPRWHDERVAILGDAAHATSPQLGQGANLALVDAAALADALAACPRDLARALERYTESRRSHLLFYQLATRWLTPFFQSDLEWLAPLRDVGMRLMRHVPPFRRTMAGSMCGVMSGLLGGTVPLEAPPRSIRWG